MSASSPLREIGDPSAREVAPQPRERADDHDRGLRCPSDLARALPLHGDSAGRLRDGHGLAHALRREDRAAAPSLSDTARAAATIVVPCALRSVAADGSDVWSGAKASAKAAVIADAKRALPDPALRDLGAEADFSFLAQLHKSCNTVQSGISAERKDFMPSNRTETEEVPTQTLILDAAERLLAQIGYRKMTMDDIAKEAGISRRTVYGYFNSKEQVILGTIDRIAARVAERLGMLSEKPESAADRLRQMLIDRVRLRGDSVRPYAKALEEIFAALRPQYLARRERYFQAEAAVIASVLRQGQRSGELAVSSPLAMARLLILSTNAFLPHGLSPQQILTDEQQTLRQLKALVSLLLQGLRTESVLAAKQSRKQISYVQRRP